MLGSSPIRSFTAFRNRCLQPKIPLRGLDAHVAEQKPNLLEFAAGLVAQPRAGTPQIVWRNTGKLHFAHAFNNAPDHFVAEPVPAIRPALLIARRSDQT